MSLPKAAELDAEIPVESTPRDLTYICMTQYDSKFALPMVIPPESMDNLLANVMAKYELRNLRVAETEKYAHVTYFFNGGIEKPFAGRGPRAGGFEESGDVRSCAGDVGGGHR